MESVVQNVDTGIIYTVQSNASRTPTLSSVSPSPSPLGQAPVDRSENATCMQFDESMLDETSIIRILRAVDLGLEGREHAHNHPCHFAIVTINGQEVPLEMIYRGNIMHSAYPVFSYTDLTTTTTMILNILPIRPAKGISASYTHSRQEIIGSINGCDQKHLTDMIKYQVKQDDVNYLIVDIASLLSTAVKRGIYVKVCSSDIHQAPAPE